MGTYKVINKDYIHHQKSSLANVLREVVFGVEDGMVSTLGSITGIAIGSNNHAVVILAGVVIISVESISMGIGSYLSNRSQEEVEERKIKEEKEELEKFPKEEKEELCRMYLKDGWSKDLAIKMSEEVSKNKELILKEMIVHELKISGDQKSVSIKGGFYMFFAYILGGIVPLFAYFILPIKNAIPLSIVITLIGLFVLGMSTTKFTKQPLIKSGLRVLIMGGIALFVGLVAGVLMGQ
ncbi:MAG: Conserved Archaeal membrane protein [Parcubacteria group bacterium GW2011_GWB1_36_5]|nr:MAG: Conserved Archaeal membrane protein [Parcubacteria group bacterium GW2011_GWB1_36_5]